MTVHRIQLPYGHRPYLHANESIHRMELHRRTQQVYRGLGYLVRHHKVGTGHSRITVGLEWVPKVRRRRDLNENLAPLVKACVDGLVAAQVVVDDIPEIVERTKPVLLEPDREAAGLWLVVETP